MHWANEMVKPKCIVYVLRSVNDTTRYYTGVTSDLDLRLADQNAGRCEHTANGRPWHVDLVGQFADEPVRSSSNGI